ncbi:hypothetical protein SAMN04489740_0850 [Arthrobacter alpinus]|uniref:Uncharacterized protein n=1 Tax=Arthrobacter alpinus TaxID=656366 RepID=A0A1H5GU00_9MICC|nr:hypothetical protein [Arthrobacter alpinus]SEE19192.1 hypothetical protein SAMN04489740_0850 [Arthrobacter alpinus]
MDPQIVETIKAFVGPALSGGGVLGFYLLYRKFEAETRASLREDNETLRTENKDLRAENKDLREGRRPRDEESAV